MIGGIFNIAINQSTLPVLAAYVPRALIVIGPAVGAITVTYITDGKSGIQDLLRKLVPRNNHAVWYFVIPVCVSAITFASFMLGGLPLSRLIAIMADSWYYLLFHYLIQTMLIGIGEELGWRGWLLPHLITTRSLAISMLIVALIWGLWHFPILFMGYDVVMPWLLILLSATVILTLVWIRAKGNILLVAMTHASINSTQFFMENQLGENDSKLIIESWRISGFLFLIIGIIFLFIMRKMLFRKFNLNPEPQT